MSANIKKWTDRLTDSQHNFATTNEARDAEIADLRAALQAQQGEVDQEGFEAWALSHGALLLEPAVEMTCENGWFPATYHSALTEIAWRAWANRPLSAAGSSAPATRNDIDALMLLEKFDLKIPADTKIQIVRDCLAAAGNSQRQDGKRLEFMAVNEALINYNAESTKCRVLALDENGDLNPMYGRGDNAWKSTPREAIDAAIAALAAREGE